MIGIYKYQNKTNGKCYVGQSIDLEQRIRGHKSAAFNKDACDYNSQFHQAVRKYGWDNFDYEVIAIVTPEEYSKQYLNQLEKFFVKYYNSFENGYNATEGGDVTISPESRKGSKNGRALLNEEEVIYIRECYNSHIPFREVFAEFEDKISKRGLQKIWWFETWKHILPEYHTEENKYWHSHQGKSNCYEVASDNKRCFSEEEVRLMRKEYDENGLSPKQIWLKYAPERAWSTVYNVLIRATYKDIE